MKAPIGRLLDALQWLPAGDGAAEEYSAEGPAEIFVEDGVDDRIESGIDVAEPKGEGETPRLDIARRTHRR